MGWLLSEEDGLVGDQGDLGCTIDWNYPRAQVFRTYHLLFKSQLVQPVRFIACQSVTKSTGSAEVGSPYSIMGDQDCER